MTAHTIEFAVGAGALLVGLAGAIIANRREHRRRLLDPRYCYPALGPDVPHDFQPYEGVTVCGRCGGGELHQIHTGGPWPIKEKEQDFSELEKFL